MNKITRSKGIVTLSINNDNVTQTIQVPYNKFPWHVDALLLAYSRIDGYHRHMIKLREKVISYDAAPIIDWRDQLNLDFTILREYAFDAIQESEADEKMVTNIIDVADSMYKEVHEFYRSFN